jgi:ATP-dependent Lon protease
VSFSTGDLTHTGRLGEVMKESVEVVKIAVFNFLTNHNLAKDFDKEAYHLHVPQGSIPKDGPSAGLSLFAALTSIATKKPVLENLALTGEITTIGEVISIGGVREKLTACKNHNINRVVLPLSNKKHVKKLPEEFKRGFTIFYVKDIDQAYKICFESQGSVEYAKKNSIDYEKFEEDKLKKTILDHENILKRNSIEELY